ncbi:Glutamine-dependent NAD(+) synthetase [Glycine soja]
MTRSRPKVLADEIGSCYLDVDGGSNVENLSLQNIEARIRMVLAFMLPSLLPWVHNKPGFYLVLGSSNVDEGNDVEIEYFYVVAKARNDVERTSYYIDVGVGNDVESAGYYICASTKTI